MALLVTQADLRKQIIEEVLLFLNRVLISGDAPHEALLFAGVELLLEFLDVLEAGIDEDLTSGHILHFVSPLFV